MSELRARFAETFPDLDAALGGAGARRLLLIAAPLRIEPGTPLVRGGERAEHVHLLLDGAVDITADGPDGAVHLWTVRSGETVGGDALLDPRPAELTAVTAAPCTALRLGSGAFDALLVGDPVLAQALLDQVATDLSRVRDRLATLFTTLCAA